MAVDKQDAYDPGIYFLTFTNYKWLHLFEITQSYDLLYSWLNLLKSNGHHIIGNAKRFIAYDIVESLEEAKNDKLLKTISDAVLPSDKRSGKLHEIFEPSSDLKLCGTYKFVKQKLDYIHSIR